MRLPGQWLAKAQLLVAQGNLDAAAAWATSRSATVDRNFEYTEARYCEQAALARWLIARGRQQPTGSFLSDAARLLQGMQREVERTGLTGRSIEIRMLHALLLQAQGDVPQAGFQLAHLLALAEPEGYLRLFVDEGQPMHSMLIMCRPQVEKQSPSLRSYLSNILSSFTRPEEGLSVRPVPTGHFLRPATRLGASDLVEALSDRELEVLRLLAGGLSTRQIADALVITTGTVRNHLKSIYGKIDAHSRVQAVERARTLKLL